MMLSCKNSSSSTKDVRLNFVTNDSITPYTISIKKYSYINKYIRDILKELNISKNQGLLSIERDENINCYYKGIGVGTEFYEDDIKSAESFIIDNVNLFDLQKMVHHYLIIYNLGL